MPVYNAAKTLDAALDSIRGQLWPDWELIALDDGSTDDSLSRLQRHASEDNRIRVHSMSHSGIVPALQKACSLARGELIARMDADDVALPHRLSAQRQCFDSEPTLGLCGARVHMSGANIGVGRRRYASWINGLVRHEDMVRELFVECPIPHPTFMMRREYYHAIGGYRDSCWPEDYDLVFRVWRAGGRFSKPDSVLLEWRESPKRLSMNDERYSPRAFRTLKRHFLTPILRSHAVWVQWGAGEVGKQWLREWSVPPTMAVDINPRKLGKRIHGVPISPPETLPPPGDCFIVIAVGAPGARDEIRAWLTPRGYREVSDYLFIA